MAQTIHIVAVSSRFGDFVKAYSTKEKADAFYVKTLREWWEHVDLGEWPEDISEAAAIYFESPRRDDENDLEQDEITLDEEDGA